ncbi:MAG: gluconate 2-dehydrogenase subunit 3 family protein [Halobacteria archaeon]|nr:gluconate 2-dehydrogenase subunit 3 family protein [Halobacteria archaeon]
MRLTRRDLMAALAAVGVGGAALVAVEESEESDQGTKPLTDEEVEVFVAAAETVYPSELEADETEEFVSSYVLSRAHDSPDRAERLSDAVAYLDKYAESWYGDRFADLSRDERDEALRAMGAETADPDPEGSGVEAVRYHVVNELLFALYTTPTGGELVGLENPQGHPGGTSSYTRGPDV